MVHRQVSLPADSASANTEDRAASGFSLRKILFWAHLCTGVAGGLVIFVLALTGVLLAYEQRIIDVVDAEYESHPPADGSGRSLETVVRSALELAGAASPVDITVAADPEEPVEVRVGRERLFYLDAWSGALLGDGSQRVRRFFSWRQTH